MLLRMFRVARTDTLLDGLRWLISAVLGMYHVPGVPLRSASRVAVMSLADCLTANNDLA